MSATVNVGPESCKMVCPSCNAENQTKIDRKATTKTHAFACLLCLCLCWPCVCVPYCMNSCRNTDHYCSKCNSYIGTYKN